MDHIYDSDSDWRVELSEHWDVLGPFPIHAREQHFLSPAFPLNLSEPVDLKATYPSSYADGGRVSWSGLKSTSASGGNLSLKVSFPAVRWQALRATEGWAALQHHAVLRAYMTVYPPTLPSENPPHLLVQLIQGSFFTIIPSSGTSGNVSEAEWHAGNIYDIQGVRPRAVNFPIPPSATSPTVYEIFISGDYEIRLFGDPHFYNPPSETPVQSLSLNVAIPPTRIRPTTQLVHEPQQDVTPDFVSGFAFGEALGIALRSTSSPSSSEVWWTVEGIEVKSDGLSLTLLNNAPIQIAPSQTRILPIRVMQDRPFTGSTIIVSVSLVSFSPCKNHTRSHQSLTIIRPIVHRTDLSAIGLQPLAINATYFFATSMPTAFLVIPPKSLSEGELSSTSPAPPILALHGAGVDIFAMSFWVDSLPRQNHSWVVVPSGRTSWGLDWHGPSAQDAWGSLDSLLALVHKDGSPGVWSSWQSTVPAPTEAGLPAVIIGHSNGGQGAWYLASRYPDRVLAVVPAAGYIKSQSYVPLTMSRSAHYIDPSLRAILETSLTPDDNDLFLTNLVDVPVFAIHGGDDDNVPVWHSREAVSVLNSWKSRANSTASLSFREDTRKKHWYPSILSNEAVDAFLETMLSSPSGSKTPQSKSYTLTVATPTDSGSLHGFKIERLTIPGRLGRLHVEWVSEKSARIRTINVKSFSVYLNSKEVPALNIDGCSIPLPSGENKYTSPMEFSMSESNQRRVWQMNEDTSLENSVQPSGRMQTILTSEAPIYFVIPDDNDSPSRELSVVLRLAQDLYNYHKLDAGIMYSSEALRRLSEGTLGRGNIVVVGTASTPFVSHVLSRGKTPFLVENGTLKLREESLDVPGLGVLFLHPHPINPSGKMLFMLSTDDSGSEKAARLFPIRTGVTVPDWLITGSDSNTLGAGAIVGAGVWGREWSWNEPMSWLYYCIYTVM